MPNSVNRRDFIKEFSLSLAALALAPGVARATKRGDLTLQGAPQNVVILGGGLAGLAAGYELKKAGHRITILEARKFPGGRVQTLRDFADGQYAEAGALSFPQAHTFTYGYATEFGLPLQPVAAYGMDSVSAMDGVVTEAIASSGAFYEIAGGNDQLASALKKKIKKFFRKQSIVTRIEQDTTGAVVTYENSDGPQTITADRVICALPFPILKNIPITPTLPDDKQRATNEIKLTPVTHPYQQVNRRVW